jgi:glycosyltransferase involved in cell wall biosynthesis
MSKHFKIENKPWVVIEGMVNPEEIDLSNSTEKSNKKIVLYTGTLAKRYGILDLLDAFVEIEDVNFELWICGAGDTEDQIKLTSKQDKRIKFLGLLPREQILNLQRSATVLVNPRNAEGEYTKYSISIKNYGIYALRHTVYC